MLRLVEVTNAETGWKGDWYRPGNRHWVRLQPLWPQVYKNKWEAVYQCGGINDDDCKVVLGPWHPWAWVRTILFNLGF